MTIFLCSGQSFLNDPSMTDSSEVKASIKLQFQNRNEEVCVAVRSLQVVKKKSKLEFKTLDGVLKTTSFADGSSRGNKVSHSLKCSEMDRIIPNSLGISAAIVENVIFVHQEDSNWPMMEGITLKSRFDDIFESTRYTKALEALAKAKKEFVAKSKDLKVEVAEYSGHIVAISQLKNDLESISGSNKDCDEAIRSLETNIEKIQQEVIASNCQLFAVLSDALLSIRWMNVKMFLQQQELE